MTIKKIAIRADASIEIGVGHIMRCLTLARKLSSSLPKGEVSVYFICFQLPAYLVTLILKENFNVVEISDSHQNKKWDPEFDAKRCVKLINELDKFDVMILDHYQLDFLWQKKLKPYYSKLLVIDDLANRKHKADFLLDQTVNRKNIDYYPYVEKSCQLLIGQSYTLLRDEFKTLRPAAINKRDFPSTLKSILISFGGTDVKNCSKMVIECFIELSKELGKTFNYEINIVMGSSSEQINIIKNLIEPFPWISLHVDSENMGTLILNADIAIGASGTSAWERCCLGLPTISFELADNQKLISQKLAEIGAIINLGFPKDSSKTEIIKHILHLTSNSKSYTKMVNNCFNVCNADGAERVVNKIIS